MREQAESHAPCSANAVHGGRALVQAHDLSNVTLEALVREPACMGRLAAPHAGLVRASGTQSDARERARSIGNAALSSIGAGTPIFGPLDTILVMDHALVHGMADHTTLDFAQCVVY